MLAFTGGYSDLMVTLFHAVPTSLLYQFFLLCLMTRGTSEASLHACEVRKTLRCRHFCDGKQVVRDAGAGGVSLPFVEFCLTLRADYRTRNTQTMMQGLTGQCPRWLNIFSKTLFSI